MDLFKNAEAVLFDLDGTLLDTAPDLGSAADQMRVRRGLPSLPIESYRHMAGAGARGMLGIAFGIAPQDAGYEDLRDEFFASYEACMTERTVAFGGVPELVDALVALKLPWGVVTNKAARFAVPLTRQIPLFSTAGALVCGDTTPHTKPHPAPLLEAAHRLDVLPSRCIYVGDDERDVVAGLAAGMGAVAAAYGYLGLKANVGDWGAHAHINSPLALLNLIRKA